ncbi:MAG: hypothetical protein EA382_00970 [Spirochaetaceae bacterium]|nr:MAG: hypothetical protein EA382_00970 [Spirochaetaceae bacterium]
MNKKANTILFMLGATVANVLLMVAIFIVLFLIYGNLIAGSLSPEVNQIVLIVLFLGSIALTYFLYHRIIKWMSKKWDLDEYFDPIFARRGQSKKD